MRPICDRFRTQRIASLPLRDSTMRLWHAERVSATNQSERGERRGGALRGTPGEAAAFRCVRPLIANGDHVPTGR